MLLTAHKHTTSDEFLEISPTHGFVTTKLSVGKPVFGDPKRFQLHLLLWPAVPAISLRFGLLERVLQQFPRC